MLPTGYRSGTATGLVLARSEVNGHVPSVNSPFLAVREGWGHENQGWAQPYADGRGRGAGAGGGLFEPGGRDGDATTGENGPERGRGSRAGFGGLLRRALRWPVQGSGAERALHPGHQQRDGDRRP